MTYEDRATETKLITYIREECLPKNDSEELDVNDNLFDRGIVDSAGLISFLGYIEQEFNLTIPDEDLLPKNFASIASITNYIHSHRKVMHAND